MLRRGIAWEYGRVPGKDVLATSNVTADIAKNNLSLNTSAFSTGPFQAFSFTDSSTLSACLLALNTGIFLGEMHRHMSH